MCSLYLSLYIYQTHRPASGVQAIGNASDCNLKGLAMVGTHLGHAIRDKLPSKPQFTDQVLSKALKGKMITFKIARDCPAERNKYDFMESRRTHALWITSPAFVNMRKICVDKFGINVHLRRSHGRSARGDRVYRKVGG